MTVSGTVRRDLEDWHDCRRVWARVVQARTEHDDLDSQRVWTLRKGTHEAVIDVSALPSVGDEITLSVDASGDAPGSTARA